MGGDEVVPLRPSHDSLLQKLLEAITLSETIGDPLTVRLLKIALLNETEIALHRVGEGSRSSLPLQHKPLP